MSQKYLNIRKLEIPEIISNNIFFYRNFRYELLTKKYRAIRALAQVQAIHEAIHDRRRCIEYYYIFDTIRYIFHIRITHIALFVLARRQLDAALSDYAFCDQCFSQRKILFELFENIFESYVLSYIYLNSQVYEKYMRIS